MERFVENKEYDYLGFKRLIGSIAERYGFISCSVIGKSCAGRDIPALKLGSGPESVLFAAAFHGSEYITENILMYFIEELCHAIKNDGEVSGINARRALFGRGLIFVPCVNPDGCEIAIHGKSGAGALGDAIAKLCKNDFKHWNANIRGVDINHNFDADWQKLREKERKEGIYGPSPTRFGGFKSESEPETIALCELCRSKRVRHIIALHSQGEVIYWSYGNEIPKRSEKMAEIMATSSGYKLDVPLGLADGGGFKDWFITEFKKPGFTIELGSGSNPLPIDSAFEIYARVREMLMLAAIM